MELKELYESLYVELKSQIDIKENLKEKELAVKEDYALALGYLKKSNEPDISKIQSSSFKSAIELYTGRTDKNKLEEALSNQEEYIKDMKNELITKDNIIRITSALDLIEENKENIKEIKKDATGIFDKTIIKAIEDIVKIQLKEEKLREEGETGVNKDEYLRKLKEIAKELNIEI